MVTLTDPIDDQNVVDRFADYVRATANSGISWGTNAYPFPEWTYGSIFGGTTAGKAIEVSGANLGGTGALIVADTVYNVLIAETTRYTRIRLITAQLFVSGGGGNRGTRPTPGTVYNQTAVAHLTSAYQVGVSAGRSDVYVNNTITRAGAEAMFNNMRTAYTNVRNSSAGTFVTTVCHASCHSSCHNSRGRR